MARASPTQGNKIPAAVSVSTDRAPRRSLIWLQGLLCGSIVTLATPSALLLGIMLAPAGLAYRWDREPGQPMARVVLVCALAGAVIPMRTLWGGGHGMPLAVAMLGDVWTWLPAWAASGGGWLLAELAPIGVRAVLELAVLARATRLRAQRAKLENEWGIAETDEA